MNGLPLDEDRGPVLVAIDADPNENAELVRNAVRSRGNKGLFAIAPQEMVQDLVSQFGPEIVTPPTAPIVVISPDQTSAKLLPRGIKSRAELREAVEQAQ
jgi:hypothetical protein